MTPAEVLRKAKGLIEERGWTQGEYINADGCYCARGACYAAAGCTPGSQIINEYSEHVDVCTDAHSLLAEAAGVSYLYEVATWNDETGRTKGEVLAAFDRAIALAEASK